MLTRRAARQKSYSQSKKPLDRRPFLWYIITMKARNIIHNEGGEPFTVHQHIILRNFWEYYLGETDKDGVAFGFVMGNENEWGSTISTIHVSLPEIGEYTRPEIFVNKKSK